MLEESDEGQLQSALSILDSSVECASFHEPTTFVHPQHPQRKRETSVFKRTSIFYGLQSPLIHEIELVSNLSARQILLRRCGQQEPLLFDDIYSQRYNSFIKLATNAIIIFLVNYPTVRRSAKVFMVKSLAIA